MQNLLGEGDGRGARRYANGGEHGSFHQPVVEPSLGGRKVRVPDRVMPSHAEGTLNPAEDIPCRSRLLHEHAGQKTFALIFDAGDEAMRGLTEFARERGLSAAHFTAIGAFESATLGYFDWQKKDYRKNPVGEQVEVVSLIGDVTAGEKGGPKVHAHVVLGRADGSALAGHLLEGRVRPTLEVVLVESPAHLQRRHDEQSGLALIRL